MALPIIMGAAAVANAGFSIANAASQNRRLRREQQQRENARAGYLAEQERLSHANRNIHYEAAERAARASAEGYNYLSNVMGRNSRLNALPQSATFAQNKEMNTAFVQGNAGMYNAAITNDNINHANAQSRLSDLRHNTEMTNMHERSLTKQATRQNTSNALQSGLSALGAVGGMAAGGLSASKGKSDVSFLQGMNTQEAHMASRVGAGVGQSLGAAIAGDHAAALSNLSLSLNAFNDYHNYQEGQRTSSVLSEWLPKFQNMSSDELTQLMILIMNSGNSRDMRIALRGFHNKRAGGFRTPEVSGGMW